MGFRIFYEHLHRAHKIQNNKTLACISDMQDIQDSLMLFVEYAKFTKKNG